MSSAAYTQNEVIAQRTQGGNGAPSGRCNAGSRKLNQRPGADLWLDWKTATIWVCISETGNPTTSGLWTRAQAEDISAVSSGLFSIIKGPDTPGDENGEDGDFYLATDTGNFYEKSDGSWGDPIFRFGTVYSVFGRSGDVLAAPNDYTWSQVDKSNSSLSDITTRSASDLSSGTLPDDRFPATLPAASGVNLTTLNANNLSSGTIPNARFPATLPVISGANLTNLPGGALVCTQTSASNNITTTSTKTYFNVDCSIPANTLSAGKSITLQANGSYIIAAANAVTINVSMCQVQGCGSGTIVNVGSFPASTPGAIASYVDWFLNTSYMQKTSGSSGTEETQGYHILQLTSSTQLFGYTDNITSPNVNTTVQQYLTIAVTFSSSSASNSIFMRGLRVVIQ